MPIPIPGIAYPVRKNDGGIAGIAYPDKTTRLGIPGVAYPGGGPSFSAPLKSTLVTENFQGYGSPTFTRATTATVTDFESLIKTAKSGEARFEGARRVENKIVNLNGAGWSGVSSGTGSAATLTAGFTGPFGETNAFRIVCDRGAGTASTDYSQWRNSYSSEVGIARVSVWLKSNTGLSQNVLLRHNGSLAQNVVSVTTTWKRFSIPAWTSAVGSGDVSIGNRATLGDTNIDILAYGYQFEYVTGQANQNPSEYVSFGVLTSAPYHGANVDGVKYFTYENGNTVASNVVTEATGAAIPDATLHGYLAEGARTNLALYSEQFDNALWATDNFTAHSADVTSSPNGSVTADLLTHATAINKFKTVNNATNQTLTFSSYIKKSTQSTVELYIYKTSIGFLSRASFNFDTGIVTDITGTGATMTYVGNGWYRGTVTGTYDANITVGIYNTPSVYVWGAQMEAGAFASSYIPTTASAVTRNRDVLTFPTDGNVNGTNGTAYAEVRWDHEVPSSSVAGSGVHYILDLNSDRIPLRLALGKSRPIDGTSEEILNTWIPVKNTKYKVITNWGNSARKGSLNGSSVVSGSFDGDYNLGTNMSIGNYGGGGTYEVNGTIRNIKIWKYALTDEELIVLTA